MERPEQILEALIQRAMDTVDPKLKRQEVIGGLKYFETQVKCHGDRKDPHSTLVDNWRLLEKRMAGSAFAGEFQLSKGVVLIAEHLGIDKEVRPRSPFEKWEARHLFRALLEDLGRSTKFESPKKEMLEASLKYLLLEAERPRDRRDIAGIQKAWRVVHAEVTKVGIMGRYQNDEQLRDRLLFFVRGGFV